MTPHAAALHCTASPSACRHSLAHPKPSSVAEAIAAAVLPLSKAPCRVVLLLLPQVVVAEHQVLEGGEAQQRGRHLGQVAALEAQLEQVGRQHGGGQGRR